MRPCAARQFRPLAAALLVAALAATPASALELKRVQPKAAVAGAAVELKGSGLKGRGTRVTVGGKRARVLSGRARLMRIVVPKLRPRRHKLVVRRGRASASARLRVLRPFRGRIEARPDARRAKRATIGPAGGKLEATGRDGTRYELRVPAGALAKREAITVTPVIKFRGLPLTGGLARGAELEPDGLSFATPVTLTIASKRRFPRNTVGFSHSGGQAGFEVQDPGGSGRLVTIRLSHFSSAGASAAEAADFANAVAPIIAGTGTMSVGQIQRLLELMGEWERMFGQPNANPPISFCVTQPVCRQAVRTALRSLAVRIEQGCEFARAQPSLAAVRALIELDALRARLGAEGQLSTACQGEALRALIEAVKAQAEADPLESDLLPDQLGAGGGSNDLDGNGEITHLEHLLFLAAAVDQLGFPDLSADALAAALQRLEQVRSHGRGLCESDRATAERRLRIGRLYAHQLLQLFSEFDEALDFCLLEVQVAPPSATLAPGGTQQFTHSVSGLLDPSLRNEVTWSVSGGTIDENGNYTAPQAPGSYTVTATSVLNPARKATATVNVGGPMSYTGVWRGCENHPQPRDCGSDAPVTALIVPEGGSFTLYLHFENATPAPPDTSTCGLAGNGNCWKKTGSSSATEFSGDMATNGFPDRWTVNASASGNGLSGTIDLDRGPGSVPTRVWREFELTRDP